MPGPYYISRLVVFYKYACDPATLLSVGPCSSSFHPADAATTWPGTRFSEFFEVIVHPLAQLACGFPQGFLLRLLGPSLCLQAFLALLLQFSALLVQFLVEALAFLTFVIQPLAQAADDLQALSIFE